MKATGYGIAAAGFAIAAALTQDTSVCGLMILWAMMMAAGLTLTGGASKESAT